jgi:nitroimidazol reductase NimA-like FMN-containing flavoprotein (pyridoxamine 5'-phosphate oxidase superfamily)
MSSFMMTAAEREEFLSGVHVAVLAVERAGRAPLAVPVWYDYSPGGERSVLVRVRPEKSLSNDQIKS